MIEALGWTLVHFLWEGAAIALLLFVALAWTRRASLRYALGLAAMLLMSVAPVVTFFVLRSKPLPQTAASPVAQAWSILTALPNSPAAVQSVQSIDWLSACVWAWLAGVAVFGIRALGGWMLLERLRREKAQPVMVSLQRRCMVLQERLGLARTVRYLESHRVDAPAVVGWFRPVVLLPMTALTGLSQEQLEGVIAHELAHIQRFDCFVNLFQIAVETALFYHPAVWWVSRTMRHERENCCDDVAVKVCGSATTYARALTMMETWRATPALVLAANSGSLKSRISRLLGLHNITHSVPRAGLAAVGVLCAAGALLASTTFNVSFAHSSDPILAPEAPSAAAVAESTNEAPVVAQPPVRTTERLVARAVVQAVSAPPAPASASEPTPAPEPASAPEPPAKESYIDGLHAAGLNDISVDDLIALKIHGVTPEYIRRMRAAGFNVSVHQLIEMKAVGIDPEYVAAIRATGLSPSVHELTSMKAVGVTPEYIRTVRSQWSDATVHDLISMRAQGVKSSDAAEYHQLGVTDLNLHRLIELKAVGATPDYIRSMQAAGFSNLSAHQYVQAKAIGLTPEYIRTMKAAGFSNLSEHEYVEARALGITPEFIQQVESHGFHHLTMHQLIGLKQAAVF